MSAVLKSAGALVHAVTSGHECFLVAVHDLRLVAVPAGALFGCHVGLDPLRQAVSAGLTWENRVAVLSSIGILRTG